MQQTGPRQSSCCLTPRAGNSRVRHRQQCRMEGLLQGQGAALLEATEGGCSLPQKVRNRARKGREGKVPVSLGLREARPIYKLL